MTELSQLHQLAQQSINQRDYLKAHAYCVELIKRQGDHADAYFLLGIINAELGQFNKAIQLIEKAISLDSQLEYHAHLARCHSIVGNVAAALDAIKYVAVEKINRPLTLDTVGVSLSRIGLHKQALSYFQKALSLDKANPSFYYNYAVSSKFDGQFTQAREAFERAISLKTDYHQAHFALSDLGGVNQDHNHVERLQGLFKTSLAPDAALHIGHALAKEYEGLGQYNKAFQTLAEVKREKLSSIDYHFSQDKVLFDCLRKNKLDDSPHPPGFTSDKPIFVIGMPRSGTTLVERIISSHSDVTSCGELQDFGVAVKELTKTSSQKVLDVETLQAAQTLDFSALGQRYIERTQAVSGNSKHFVDKLPFNFFYISLIRRALPNAKIICLLRNPMDTCVGNFRQLFSINSPYFSYAYDLMNIGHFYQEFYRLAHSWSDINEYNFKLLNYEQLVAEPEKEIRGLIDFCGLDWQAQCLHAEQNKAPVSTASKVQVREPINAKSIGRWRQFKPFTDELEQYFESQNIPIS
ncbi:sulfotransferase [Paraglaciecola sp. MB-3u-78]|uniref:tetratricopeptide repeat-containing sulfotransferase family protein n=1 Tax=Paraglaciecola sp. MB-3u-78 TaxID=2058332 RepID=UPI000C33B529|nr:sulfotransferase [Paraglaciecola sp. MB-3u-78]PKG93400.1 sulfotransferase family protein [Paraglaciecola sp. MB-3u-78]